MPACDYAAIEWLDEGNARPYDAGTITICVETYSGGNNQAE